MGKTTITLHGHLAIAETEQRAMIAAVLERGTHEFLPGGPQGCRQGKQIVRHHSRDQEGRLTFSAGLVRRVQQHLERLGHEVEICNRTDWGHLSDADGQVANDSGLHPDERRLLAALEINPRGQILSETPADTPRAIGLLSRPFRTRAIYVIAGNRRDRDRLPDRIRQHTDRFVTTNLRQAFHHRPSVFVSTLQRAQVASGDDFQILVMAAARIALSPAWNSLCKWWPDATWYACRNVREPLTPNEEFSLKEIFGPVIYCPDDVSAAGVNVEVAFRSVKRKKERRKLSGLERKRQLYWHSDGWNDVVAATTRRLAAGERPDGLPEESVVRVANPSVALIVESPEHANVLQVRLPGWSVQTMQQPASCIPAVSDAQIATMAYAASFGISADVVVRADAGPGRPLGDALASRMLDSDARVLVVDFADNCDRQARRETESRRAAYQERGWRICTAALPDQERLH